MQSKFEITELRRGEIGESSRPQDRDFVRKKYADETGHKIEVFGHDTTDPHWHIFPDMESRHRLKISAAKYRQVSRAISRASRFARAARERLAE